MITDGESRDSGTRTLETAQLDRAEAVLQSDHCRSPICPARPPYGCQRCRLAGVVGLQVSFAQV